MSGDVWLVGGLLAFVVVVVVGAEIEVRRRSRRPAAYNWSGRTAGRRWCVDCGQQHDLRDGGTWTRKGAALDRWCRCAKEAEEI